MSLVQDRYPYSSCEPVAVPAVGFRHREWYDHWLVIFEFFVVWYGLLED